MDFHLYKLYAELRISWANISRGLRRHLFHPERNTRNEIVYNFSSFEKKMAALSMSKGLSFEQSDAITKIKANLPKAKEGLEIIYQLSSSEKSLSLILSSSTSTPPPSSSMMTFNPSVILTSLEVTVIQIEETLTFQIPDLGL